MINISNYYDTRYDYKKDLKINWKRINRWLRLIDKNIHWKQTVNASFNANLKMLDVACGVGCTSIWAEKRNVLWMGIESSRKAVIMGFGAFRCKINEGNAEDLPYPQNYFDYVVCLGSLEHMKNPHLALREMNRVCKENGKIVILVPNRIPILDWLHFNYGTEQEYEIKRTKKEWMELLYNNFIKVYEIRRDFGAKLFKNLKPLALIKRLLLKLTWILPDYFTYSWIFDCTPIKGRFNPRWELK